MKPGWLFLGVFALFLTALTRDAVDDWVAQTELPSLIFETSAEVRDRNGELLRPYMVAEGRWRMATSLSQVDPRFVDMLVAYEDKRFFDHSGIDVIAMSRAAIQALWHGRIVSGGSTLTMQVARLAEDSGTGAWAGKLRQIRVALAMERQLSKADILTLYLHLAPYGGNIEGVRAASLAYLGKEPSRLTTADVAFLVALPQSPETRRPDRFPSAAHVARDRVIHRLLDDDFLDEGTAQAGLTDRVPNKRLPFPQLAPHLSDRTVTQVSGRFDLTIDKTLQKALETMARRNMQGQDARQSLAILVADHTSGEILASVGSPGYDEARGRPGFVDMTNAKRSPGSTLKPLVYGLAFDRGIAHPETLISDTPAWFGDYAPQNFDGQFRGDLRVTRALQLSLNIPVVRLTEAVGPAHLMSALRKTGAKPVLPGGKPGLAVALGGVGLTLKELVQSYAMLAQLGTTRPLVWRKGEKAHDGERVLSARSAWQVGHILAGISPPKHAGPKGRVAYKTGTSYGHRDAWAIGFDGRYVVGVWLGRPDGTPVPGAFGGDHAAPLLFEVMSRVRATPVPLPPPPPDTLMLSNAQLPIPLRRFGGADVKHTKSVRLVFPPNGARLAPSEGQVPIKLRDGTPPFTVLANGAVVATGVRVPEFSLPVDSLGFSTLSVIDARGLSDRVHIELR